MQHAFQIVSHAPAPTGLSRHDFLESLLAVLIPFAYVVWKHGHAPMTGVLVALGCGTLMLLGKTLYRHCPGVFSLSRTSALTLMDGRLYYSVGTRTSWSVMVRDLTGHDREDHDLKTLAPLIRLHTATDCFVFPEQGFAPEDIHALLHTIGLNTTAGLNQPAAANKGGRDH
ncbi:MAG: hypothetical protein IPL70_06720 [Uliginosibacterium sp.]|nr:hypothetical protein [Uliginosibacterium sp.]